MKASCSSQALRRMSLPVLLVVARVASPGAYAAEKAVPTAEHVTLTNGFELFCDHREVSGDKIRFYTQANGLDFVELPADRVASVETVPMPTQTSAAVLPISPAAVHSSGLSREPELSRAELHELLSSVGERHNLDVNLLASLVHAESGGHARAVSKTGARGLMQLMPRTAAQLGVGDSFQPEENVSGGATYLDWLLTRYHDNLAIALAAYNAGPAAVDRWHGIPPYRETQLYVARIIRDFNAAVRVSRTPKVPARDDASMRVAYSAKAVAP